MNDFRHMYGSTPESFSLRIRNTLAKAEAERPAAPRRMRLVLATALILALSAAAAVAAFHSQAADYFGLHYGENLKEEMLAGQIAVEPQTHRVGDVFYTLEEVVHIDNGLYGLGHITPAEADVLLMAEDYQLSDAAGYGLYYGEESRAPEGAPTYAQLAQEKNARVVQVKTVPEAVGVDGGVMLPLGNVGYSLEPQKDGSVRFAFEIPTGVAVEEGQTYTIRMWSANWEAEGDPDATHQGESWEATVHPQFAKEEN